MNITVKGWDEVKNDWETEQLYLNVSQSEVNITDFNGARVTFESNAKVVRVSGMYDTSGTFKEYVADGFNQLQWGEDWNKKWNYTYDAVAKVGKGYLDIIVNNGAQTTGTYHIVLKATRKESWEGVNTLSLSRSIKVNVVQEGKRYGFEPSTAASAYVGSSYIGAFYRNKEVGERIIQNTFWGSWPSSSAATLRLPFACFNARNIRSLSSASLRKAKLTVEVGFVTASSRCSFMTTPSCACNTAPITFCRSSRTLPGHACVSNALRASELNPLTLHSSSLFAISRKNSASNT